MEYAFSFNDSINNTIFEKKQKNKLSRTNEKNNNKNLINTILIIVYMHFLLEYQRREEEEEKKIEWQHYVFRREGNTESSMIQQILQSPYFFPACHLRVGRALLQNVETICRLIHEHIPYLIDKYIKYQSY